MMRLWSRWSVSGRTLCRGVLGAVLAVFCCTSAFAADTSDSRRDGYRYYAIGDLAAPRPAPTRAGAMLVGGGDWPYPAFRWMIERAGHGRIVILRASGSTEAQDEFFNDIGGITAAQTLVFEDRRAASDPQVLDIVRQADGIFLAGGDQSNYVRYWQGTPLNRALDAHVRAGKPIGGTSAGLAILGAHAYGAMDGGSLSSKDALNDPTGPQLTLVDDFLHLPYLERVLTDSHFGKRDRLGRLIAMLARLAQEQGRGDLVGIGVDEYTALCIDGDGIGRVFSGNGGHVWLVGPQPAATVYAAGKPLSLRAVPVRGVGSDSLLHLADFRIERPAFSALYDVEAGRLIRRDANPAPTAAP
jgi:cyanophycinase